MQFWEEGEEFLLSSASAWPPPGLPSPRLNINEGKILFSSYFNFYSRMWRKCWILWCGPAKYLILLLRLLLNKFVHKSHSKTSSTGGWDRPHSPGWFPLCDITPVGMKMSRRFSVSLSLSLSVCLLLCLLVSCMITWVWLEINWLLDSSNRFTSAVINNLRNSD